MSRIAGHTSSGHIAPQIYRLIINPQPTPDCAKLRRRRQQAHNTSNPSQPVFPAQGVASTL